MIPVFSWVALHGKCRNCRESISARYLIVELITGTLFSGAFIYYFQTNHIQAMPALLNSGWLIFLVHIVLLSVLIVSSAIDLEFWIIPLSICWFVTGIAIIGMAISAAITKGQGTMSSLILVASPTTGALALGSALGLAVSICLIVTKMIKRSYELEGNENSSQNSTLESGPFEDQESFNHRKEMLHEVVFLGPVVVLALLMYWITQSVVSVGTWWGNILTRPSLAGALGSVWGYFIGCAVIWFIRILGTLGFGKEAMGLGDVHLMGCVGAVIGAPLATIAIFVAAVYGATWGGLAFVFKKSRQMPFGPFLAIGTLTVMIFHDYFVQFVTNFVESMRFLFCGLP